MDEKKHILIAEDDKFYTNIYRVKMAKLGFDVTIVGDGKLAVEEAKKRKPDLILLDMIMPTMDGFETIKALRSLDFLDDIKIIVLSSLSQAEDRQKALDLGANDYWVKANIPINELGENIKRILS